MMHTTTYAHDNPHTVHVDVDVIGPQMVGSVCFYCVCVCVLNCMCVII